MIKLSVGNLALISVLTWVGCGGEDAPAAQATRGGTTPKTGFFAGTPTREETISAKARVEWDQAMASFNAQEKKGWSGGACSNVASQFDDAADAQDGKFAEAVFMQGLIYDRCRDHDKAVEYYQKANQVDPKYCKARVALAIEKLKRGDKSQAYAEFEQAVKQDPQCTEGYANLAALQQERGNAKDALDNLRRALAIDARYLPAFNQMALLYLEQSKTRPELLELASVVCKQAQLVDRDYAPIYNTWGLVYLRKGDIIEAARMFERATTLDKHHFEANFNFGQITQSFRGYEDAKGAFERAVQINPKHYEARLGYGAALRGLKRYQEAIEQYKKAIDINSSRPEAYYNLGILYQGYLSGSVADLETARRYYRDFLGRASGGSFGNEIKELKATCQTGTSKRAKRQAARCKPGRLQNIDMSLAALRSVPAQSQGAPRKK